MKDYQQQTMIKQPSWWHHFKQERRWAINWMWLLPPLVILLILLLTHLTFVAPNLSRPTSSSEGSANGPVVQITEQQQAGPNYLAAIRDNLELYLPLAAVLMCLPLLSRDWQHGAVIQLALRKSLFRVLVERISYIIFYLFILVLIATVVSFSLTSSILTKESSFIQQFGEMLLTVFPSTLFLMFLGLFAAHGSVNSIVGYIVALTPWLANRIFVQLVAESKEKNDVLAYLLSGWNDQDLLAHIDLWWQGKIILLVCSLALFFLQLPILRKETRLIRNFHE